MVDAGAVPVLVGMLLGGRPDGAAVREQAAWALGNIAGDSPECRDEAIGHGALYGVLEAASRVVFDAGAGVASAVDVPMTRTVAWALANMCRGKPKPAFGEIKCALPTLAALAHSEDLEVLENACHALASLTTGANEEIGDLVASGVCGRLVELIG